MTGKEKEIMERAIAHYGKETQLIVCIEELSELIKELTKHLRGGDSLLGLTEEAADVSIVLDEVMLLFGIRAGVESVRRDKLIRLMYRIERDKLHAEQEQPL